MKTESGNAGTFGAPEAMPQTTTGSNTRLAVRASQIPARYVELLRTSSRASLATGGMRPIVERARLVQSPAEQRDRGA